jgi:hypothetical protein
LVVRNAEPVNTQLQHPVRQLLRQFQARCYGATRSDRSIGSDLPLQRSAGRHGDVDGSRSLVAQDNRARQRPRRTLALARDGGQHTRDNVRIGRASPPQSVFVLGFDTPHRGAFEQMRRRGRSPRRSNSGSSALQNDRPGL